MIRFIEALNYRCLHDVRQELGRFHVLVGPNASGKTTFLDVIALLGDLVGGDIDRVLDERSRNIDDLFFGRAGDRLELAIELVIPEKRRQLLERPNYGFVRYEVSLGRLRDPTEFGIRSEKVLLREQLSSSSPEERTLFPRMVEGRSTLMTSKHLRGTKTVVNKVLDGNDNFYDETGKGWDHAFKLSARKSALGNLPEDESKFPVATWLKAILTGGVQRLILNSGLMRKASPPGQGKSFKPDGSNLPWVVERLSSNDPTRLGEWIAHVRTALPDIVSINTIEREDDRHRYLVVEYEGGLRVPSWMLSDGTLRLLALTLPAYLPDLEGIFLIEEPENGIHPRAVETVFQSMSSLYSAQILVATHSPIILSIAEAENILCFAKSENGATDIVLGGEHPALRQWRGEENLGVLFAAGVLG